MRISFENPIYIRVRISSSYLYKHLISRDMAEEMTLIAPAVLTSNHSSHFFVLVSELNQNHC